jgi:general secretion pathway protein B
MSYILDALKRADAERERGAVPGLHTRQVSTTMPQTDANPRRLWLGLAVLLLSASAVGLWLWQTLWRDTTAAPVEVAAVKLAAPTAAQAVPVASTPQPVVVADVPPVPVPPASVPKMAPASAPAVAVQAASKPQPPSPAVKPAAVAPTVVAAIPLLSELPEDIRHQIPTLTITGAVDSEFPAQRMLLVNGQLLRQGSVAGQDLSLEEIRSHSSVFSFRSTKFRITY